MGIDELSLRQLKLALESADQTNKDLFPEARSIERWKQSTANPLFSSLWIELRERAERYVAETPGVLPFSEFMLFGRTGERQTYEAKYFDMRTRLSVLSLVHGIDGGNRWIPAIEDTIWAICEETTWVLPAHVGLYHNDYPNGIWDQPQAPRETVDLFAAITAFSLAEICSLLGDSLHPWIRNRVHLELERRIFQIYFHDPVPQSWEMKTNNWPAVCAAGIGAAAIYSEIDSERLAGMLWRVIGALRSHLSGFDEQGTTSEGVAYWQFGFGFYMYFSELLRERTGDRIDLLQGDKIGQIARFPNVCLLSGRKVVNFSDAPDEIDFNIGLFSRLQQRFGDVIVPEQREIAINPLFSYWPYAARLLLWTQQAQQEHDSPFVDAASCTVWKQHDSYFAGNQWAISKRSTSAGFLAFAAKGGNNGEPHNHNDLGHFLLHANGKTILEDLGAGLYTRQYFQPETRYEMLTAGSHGHSVPIVEGCRQGTGSSFHAKVLHYEKTKDAMIYSLDLTSAYDCPNLRSLTRTFHWQSSEHIGYVLSIRDTVHFAALPQAFVEVFISSVQPKMIEPGTVRLENFDMLFDFAQFELQIDPQKFQTIAGTERITYRILLDAKNLGPDLDFSVHFAWRDVG